eukprot:Colp12_sorted_trinity150504_noHs@16791
MLAHVATHTLSNVVNRLRLLKDSEEVALMQRAANISAQAFVKAMQHTRAGVGEHELEALLEYEVRRHGCTRLAYKPVVASGINCNTLHYVFNDRLLRDGDLVLVDAGGEYQNYASDITRTFPVSGRFSEGQREVYEAVLRVQKTCIKLCTTASNLSLNSLHNVCVNLLKEELCALGIVKAARFTTDALRETQKYFPHHLSHYLGSDTHDTPTISRDEPLRPGMVVTMEPGLYLPCVDSVPPKYRGIGVRIEDDVLITEGAPVVLTAECPKEPEEIEAIMQR